ncbi:hypothetical protein OCU04_007369 [Sclerotinia nivalis]|uniref:Uncharacterized protein n=1 Tax=Sclerotinia nivalis TaxID=352851 RepID=A0A9X0AM42_9HELO|nr:hypothetical protein OCU04_007369 [Sclerotinia nivalis]
MVTRIIANVLETNTTLPSASTATTFPTPSLIATDTLPSSSTLTSILYPTITILALSFLLLFCVFTSLYKKRNKITRARQYGGFGELERLLERRIMIRYLDSIDDSPISSSSFSEEPYSDNPHPHCPWQQNQNEDLEGVDNHGWIPGGNCPWVTHSNAPTDRNEDNGHNSVDSDDELWLLVDYQMEAGNEWAENRVPLDEVEIARMQAREMEGEGRSPGEFWR